MLLTLVLLHLAESQLAVRDVKLIVVETVPPGMKDYELNILISFFLPFHRLINACLC